MPALKDRVMVRIWQIITLTLAALVMGTSFAHVLEWPAKLQYDGVFYLRLQTSLYSRWGPPSVSGFIEPAAILAVLFLGTLVRDRPSVLRLTVAAAGCLLLAFPLIFFWRVAPANAAFTHAAKAGTLPADWNLWRTQWETGHALRFVLHFAAFILLSVSFTVGVSACRKK